MEIGNSAVTAAAAHVSALSRSKAANGDGNFSTETQQAIASGAVAPTVARAVEETEKPSEAENQEPSVNAQQLAARGTFDGLTDAGLSATAQSLPTAGAVLPDIGSTVNITI